MDMPHTGSIDLSPLTSSHKDCRSIAISAPAYSNSRDRVRAGVQSLTTGDSLRKRQDPADKGISGQTWMTSADAQSAIRLKSYEVPPIPWNG